MNKLKGQRAYLAGAIDRVSDRGIGWREFVTPFLQDLGVTILNPLDKPCKIGVENNETHLYKKKLKEQQNYETLSNLMKNIRCIDLRLVDISDFLIVNLNLDTHPCGTYEEIFWANRQKKPIIIHIEQGKQSAPDWLFGTIPHEMIFSNWEGLKNYLRYVNSFYNIEHYNRWYFLND